jgi:GNAT superfamily N-acetyltransferase
MTNQDILRITLEQQAIDNSCSPEDFLKKENVVVISKPHETARRYLNLPFFCDLTTYGSNVVASVDDRVYDFVKEYINAQPAEHCLQTPSIAQLAAQFSKYGFMPCFQAEYWLPDMRVLHELPCPYPVKILEPADFVDLYLPEWGNALSEKRKHLDMLAVGAYDDDKLIALAGCSAVCDTMWQIGIDVLPEYRRKGIASALTAKLALEIVERGKVPFYCCAWSNMGSARNAIASGFRPAWAEHTAISREKVIEMLPLKNHVHNITSDFWSTLDTLIADSELVIDRPKGTKHPRFDFIYPLDYGYLKNTFSMDGDGIDVWRGSLPDAGCDSIICTIDTLKRDSEIKVLLGCTEDEKDEILRFHNDSQYMKGLMIRREL